MKKYLSPVFCSVLLLAGWMAIAANAQNAQMAQAHVAKARAAAYEPGRDLTYLFDGLCQEPRPAPAAQPAAAAAPRPAAARSIPPRAEWYAPPAKIFDNLYFVGTLADSAWALTTSEGIIMIDSAMDYSAEAEIVEGLKKMGLDPAQIKYVIAQHAHGDRFAGSKLLQERYKARVILSEADWNVMAKSTEPAEFKPKKDMVATDGMKVTLGDTTVTIYITPGHTAGTISTIFPVKDGNQRHIVGTWGGNAVNAGRDGVQYFANEVEAMKTWGASSARFSEIAKKAGVDAYVSIHPHHDKTLEKINALKFRMPGDPHPFVGPTLQNLMTMNNECMAAQVAWRTK